MVHDCLALWASTSCFRGTTPYATTVGERNGLRLDVRVSSSLDSGRQGHGVLSSPVGFA